MEETWNVRLNGSKVTSVMQFAQIKGKIQKNCKDVYFVRLLGDDGRLFEELAQLNTLLAGAMARGECVYQRLFKLPGIAGQKETAYYADCYDKWKQEGETQAKTEASRKAGLPPLILGKACQEAVKALASCKSSFSPSMEKNFTVKLLFWLDQALSGFPVKWEPPLSVKIVADNIVSAQEYCFFYFLTLLGMDVLLVQSRRDIEPRMDERMLSGKHRLGDFTEREIPAFDVWLHRAKDEGTPGEQTQRPVKIQIPERNAAKRNSVQTESPVKIQIPERNSAKRNTEQTERPVRVQIPERNAAKGNTEQTERPVRAQIPERNAAKRNAEQTERPVRIQLPERNPARGNASRQSVAGREKTFEELALLASSVVMIGIHDRRGEMIGTGSGIMVGAGGYILTNNHVASGGCFYSVRIEEEERVYETEEVIKYHPVLDLAILRIDRRLSPLPVYSGGQKLVRGQRVVAIGSPLGLFNSVSDGIISGFRVINDVDMIQFTAPISHGSSGGALLNMQGQVIGISTAGFDEGQNINLAVGYECINLFIAGFKT